MPKRDRRCEIMRAAERLFTSRRYHEVTLDDVVREARVGKGTVYRYFRSKDDLFFQIATRGFDDLCSLLEANVPDRGPFEGQLLEVCRQITGFFLRRRQWMRMVQAEDGRMHWESEPIRSRWLRERHKLVAAVGAILERGVAAKKIRRDVPAEVLANFVLGMLRTRARDLENWETLEKALAFAVDIFLNGAGDGQPQRTQRTQRRTGREEPAPEVASPQKRNRSPIHRFTR
jgi:AcrR family transcriptional regulator